MLDLFT
jgi:serine/threonine protein kinase